MPTFTETMPPRPEHPERCACGMPVHWVSPSVQRVLERRINEYGWWRRWTHNMVGYWVPVTWFGGHLPISETDLLAAATAGDWPQYRELRPDMVQADLKR